MFSLVVLKCVISVFLVIMVMWFDSISNLFRFVEINRIVVLFLYKVSN